MCYHHHLIYEAKILKATSLDDENTSITRAIGPQYYVDYKEWKEKWNKCIPAERLLKKTPENLRLLIGARPRSGWLWSGQVLRGFEGKKRGRKRPREQVCNKTFISVVFFLRIARC